MSVDMSSEEIRVGVLFSTTGTTAVVEHTQRNAVEMALDEINASGGAAGRKMSACYVDPASNPRNYRQQATDLMTEFGVRLFIGCYMSSTRKAVLPVIEENKALLFYPTLYEGFEFSPNCYYGGAAPNQNSIGLASYLLENYGERFYLLGSNYVFPYESNRIMRDFIISNGGQIAQERYVPLITEDHDFDRVIEEIAKLRPDVILSTIVGDSTSQFYRAYREAGFDARTMPIGSLTTGEPEVTAMGVDAARGHITSAPYFSTIDSRENQHFVREYRARYGKVAPISACTEAAYAQTHLLALAIGEAGSGKIADIRNVLPAVEFAAPQGPVRIDGENNHTFLWPRIGRVDTTGTFEIVTTSPAAVRPDPYLISAVSTDWNHAQAVS